MAIHSVIVIGASAGGVEALSTLAGALPEDLAAAVLIVIHVPGEGRSLLPRILNRSGKLEANHPSDGEEILPGRIYVAPPDFHMLVERDRIRLSHGPQESLHRPAIDPLFRSAAQTYGPRVIGVILSGTRDDGTAGLYIIKQRGGVAVVQDPDDALFEEMPRSAIENVVMDYVLPLAEIGPSLARLVKEAGAPAGRVRPSPELDYEIKMDELDPTALESLDQPGEPSRFACPDCGGVLWEVQDGQLLRFRCRVGHAYTSTTLLDQQTHNLEGALWAALRALEEKLDLARRVAERARLKGHASTAEQFERQMRAAERQSEMIRSVLANGHGENTAGQ